MIFSSPLVLAFLSAGAAWAIEIPMDIASSGGNCLTISNASLKASYDECCPSETATGKGSVNSVEFTYSCGHWASPYNTAVTAANPHECAKLCAASSTCPATSWTRGKCYFATSQGYRIAQSGNFLLMEKTGEMVVGPEPESGCGKQINDTRAQCEKETAAKCEVEKAAVGESVKTEYQKKVDSSKTTCDAAKAQLEAEKQGLQKSLDEAIKKLTGVGTGNGTDGSGSHTTLENEALISKISKANFYTLCPRFKGRLFITVDSEGYNHEWTILCNRRFFGHVDDNNGKHSICHTQDIVQLLKENHDNSQFSAIWIKEDGNCNIVRGGFFQVNRNKEGFPSTHLYLQTDGTNYNTDSVILHNRPAWK